MKRSNLIFTFLIIVILFLCSVIILDKVKKSKTGERMDNAVIENILTRTSIRDYLDTEVEDEKIELILKAAMAAPSAVNKQPWTFVVIKDRSLLDSLASNLKNAKMLRKAPLAIAVCGDMFRELDNNPQGFWIQDASAATENILLAAHSLGLGSVWTGLIPRVDRAALASKIMQLPDNLIPLNIIPIGYPTEHPIPKDKWKPELIINR